MLMTREGMIIRVPISGVRITGRAAQGVKLINLAAGDEVVDVARVVPEESEEEAPEAADGKAAPESPEACTPTGYPKVDKALAPSPSGPPVASNRT